tara:strand:- start:151190 stop:151399 length:210 start_codon:yes stop_codon:yes gene_type:complete
MSRHNDENDLIIIPPGYHDMVAQDMIDQNLDLNVVFAQCVDGFDAEEANIEAAPIEIAELPEGFKDYTL